MIIKEFYDEGTHTLSYVVHQDRGNSSIVIDPVWNIDTASGRLSQMAVKKIFHYLEDNALRVDLILETHAHADHLSSSQIIKKQFPNAKIAIHEKICDVQKLFSAVFNAQGEIKTDGCQFDLLLKDQEQLEAANLKIKVIATPGHTPACSSFLIEDVVFVGDAIFVPDSGTGRCDFPAGSSEDLFHSVKEKLYALPESTKVFVGHDYQPGGRQLEFKTNIKELKEKNSMLDNKVSKDEFIAMRTRRDASLAAPKLLLPSIQVNIRAGCLPEPESNGTIYLKLPLKLD